MLPKVKFHLKLKDTDVIANKEIFEAIKNIELGINENNAVREILYPSEECEIINQYTVIADELEGIDIPVKGRLDRVHIDHKHRTVDIIDFKSTSLNTDKFLSAFFKFKYYYQLPFYTTLFKLANPELDEYTYTMKFFVVSKSTPKVPAVFILPNIWLEKSWQGYTTPSKIEVKGINEILKEIEWYQTLGGTEVPYELAMNDNILTIKNNWDE